MAKLTVEATDGAGSFEAYHVAPGKEGAGAVVLIQEIFGVNQAMRDEAAEVAAQGYHVLVPDLFWRIRPGIDLTDKSEAEWNEAVGLMKKFNQNRGVVDLKATLAAARELPGANGRVATMGYCLGGRLALMMAAESDADLNISYYGVGLDDLIGGLDKVSKPLLLHIAGEDKFFPAEGRAKLIEAAEGRPMIHAYNYPGADHAFARINGVHYDARAAAIANGRSAEALMEALS